MVTSPETDTNAAADRAAGRGARPRRLRVPLPLLVAWLVFVTYFAAARVSENLFPFSIFDMYRGGGPERAARILVLDAQGRRSELSQWEAFRCEPERPQLASETHCGDWEPALGYITRDQQIHLDEHRGPGGTHRVRIVSRRYALDAREGEPVHEDCVVATCLARPRGDGS